jgi:microcystin-dependent protein
MSEPFIGQSTLFPYNFAPQNWIECQGQLLPIRQYSALFSLLGTSFGGNGTTTFAVPDLQGRVAVGMGSLPGGGVYDIGQQDGVENATVSTAQMAAHNHSLNATQNNGTVNTAAGNILSSAFVDGGFGNPSAQGNVYNPGIPNTPLQPGSLGLAGSSLAHNNMQPFLALRYCIALSGVFPSRQ